MIVIHLYHVFVIYIRSLKTNGPVDVTNVRRVVDCSTWKLFKLEIIHNFIGVYIEL